MQFRGSNSQFPTPSFENKIIGYLCRFAMYFQGRSVKLHNLFLRSIYSAFIMQ